MHTTTDIHTQKYLFSKVRKHLSSPIPALRFASKKHVEYFIGKSKALKGFPDYKFLLCFCRGGLFEQNPLGCYSTIFIIPPSTSYFLICMCICLWQFSHPVFMCEFYYFTFSSISPFGHFCNANDVIYIESGLCCNERPT